MNLIHVFCIDSSEVTMLKENHAISHAWPMIGLLILILDGKTAVSGAQQAIELCIKTVIPSLFPFIFLSGFLNGRLIGSSSTFLAAISKLCSIPRGAESVLLTGILGGYPVGARSVGVLFKEGKLHPRDAAHLLSFCSNAGPAFLFGMVSSLFDEPHTAFLLWGIHIFSAILVSMLHPSGPCRSVDSGTTGNSATFSDNMKASITVMATVCGWVILFRIVLVFLNRWILWALPDVLSVILTGLLELTNGCCELSAINDPGLRFVLCSGFLAFGGVCVAMQTSSVISGLPLRHYLAGKLLQTVFSLLLSASVVLNIGLPVFLLLTFFSLLPGKIQKRSGNPKSVGV